MDFAGGCSVHIVGGLASLVAVYHVGSRVGRFDAEGKVHQLPQQSSTYQTIGAFLLWFGWYGFNAVSTVSLIASTSVNNYTRGTIAALIVVKYGFLIVYMPFHHILNYTNCFFFHCVVQLSQLRPVAWHLI